MKIFKAFGTGSKRAAGTWKGILLIWFCWLIVACLVVFPVKSALKSGFGGSTITGMLLNGIDIDVIGDLGTVLKTIISSFLSNTFIIILIGIMLNAFFSGGIFNSLRGYNTKFSVSEFFRAGSKNFWPFLVITLLTGAILGGLGSIIIGIPIGIASQVAKQSESTPFVIGTITSIIYGLVCVILFLVADYARAWHANQEKPAPLKALGFGFRRTFQRFGPSYLTMLILLVAQFGFAIILFRIISYWKPITSGGVFMLFIASQALFYLFLCIKAWRYGSITALKEFDEQPSPVDSMNISEN